MKEILRVLVLSVGLAMTLFSAAVVKADLAANCSITPPGPFLLGGVPPQPGVELYIYAVGQTGVEYTFTCDVTEEPAAVVVLPAEVQELTYDYDNEKLTVRFKHVPYVAGSNVPAPPGQTTFSIALVPVADDFSGPPFEMQGSWMSTNIPPMGLGVGGWELIAPSEEEPFFGYKLNGPAEATGFFQMFIPTAMKDLMEELINEVSPNPVELDWLDLAVFNGDEQASLAIIPQDDGALVDIQVVFSEGATTLPEKAAALLSAAFGPPPGGPGQSQGVDKELTVRPADAVSLTASNLAPSKGESVTLYGWVKNCVPGQRVKLTSNAAAKKAKAAGAKQLKRYQKKGWKQAELGADCAFSQSYPAKKTDVFRAIYKAAGQKAEKSKKLKIAPGK